MGVNECKRLRSQNSQNTHKSTHKNRDVEPAAGRLMLNQASALTDKSFRFSASTIPESRV